MKRLAIVLLLAGCAAPSAPVSMTAPAPMPDPFACVMAAVNELGYTVEDADREAGFVRAARATTDVLDAIAGSEEADVLTVAIYAGEGGTQIRVTAETRYGDGRAKISRQVQEDARTLLSECGS